MQKLLPRKNCKVDAAGEVRISATFNNIIISFTNKSGQVISWSSAGKWASGVLKNTPYAAQMAAADAAKDASEAGVKRVDVFVKGPGSGREGLSLHRAIRCGSYFYQRRNPFTTQ